MAREGAVAAGQQPGSSCCPQSINRTSREETRIKDWADGCLRLWSRGGLGEGTTGIAPKGVWVRDPCKS